MLILLLIVGGLFVAADRLAVNYAEGKLADRARTARGGAEDAEVTINGFPFLTQLADRELESVDITLNGVTASGEGQTLQVNEFDVKARDITLNDSYSGGVAAKATGTAYLTYEALTEAAAEGVSIAYGGETAEGEPKVQVTGQVQVPFLGRTIEGTTTSALSVENGDTIKLYAESVPGQEIPGVEGFIRERIDYTRQINGLPPGVELTGIEATPDGVEVNFTGEQIDLAG
ncbi:DUF2993 domain-containing protein [Streptomyces sp. JJ66]|uniref:LmeA family phospholipid-binding protein n=1 Tax=Streptomyces sp. JJ66 TaxID=2803843 RepID=UPI001C598319|nr:DUF2993 domain-containing protein [Streptomyces sp. JJ66]MBW1604299.1 DUF2993 domain-containing protein [Streptomyces sp. JJ66]